MRQKLEAELAEKTEQLYKERVRLGENGRYSPSTDMMLASLGSDSTFREELSVAQRLNLQVTNNNNYCLYASILEISAIDAGHIFVKEIIFLFFLVFPMF